MLHTLQLKYGYTTVPASYRPTVWVIYYTTVHSEHTFFALTIEKHINSCSRIWSLDMVSTISVYMVYTGTLTKYKPIHPSFILAQIADLARIYDRTRP